MKKSIPLALCLALMAIFSAGQPLQAADSVSKVPAKNKSAPPGVQAAETISMLTGVAISPLLGVGTVGMWKYMQAKTPEEKAALPWFAQPSFWLPALLLVGAVFLKDSLGTAVPTALKKPLDVAETLENKISGLVATGAFVPMAATFFTSVAPTETAAFCDLGFASITLSSALNFLLVPVAMAAFFIVWIVGHAINVLILISPFSTVDAALKAFRTFLISTVAVTSFVNPYVGAVWALVIILVCYFLAGWAFRLTVFGTVFCWDFFTFRHGRFQPDAAANWMFLAREINQVPIRTYGKLARKEGSAPVFTYRPWLVMPLREMTLPQADYAVGKGLFFPEVCRTDGDKTEAVFLLPPRYRKHEEELARVCGMRVVDVGLRKGIKAFWRLIKELCGFGSKQPAAAAG